jgi:hypothetical protein
MKLLFFLCLPMAISLWSASFAQVSKIGNDKSKGNALIGTWRLIEFADSDSLGNWIYPFGKHPRGFITYTRTNIFNINMSSEVPLQLDQKESKTRSIILDEFLFKYSFGYFGTYKVDFKKSMVTHQVTGGTIPWYVGTDQPRPFILKGNTLIIGDNKTWKRVLIKAD